MPPASRPVCFYTSFVSFAKKVLLADIRYSAWANRSLLDGCSALTSDELERELRISQSSILAV